MEVCRRIIFVGKSGTCREPMAAEIMKQFPLKYDIEILARGLVVLFPEPMNQKAEAVMIRNGIELEGFASKQLTEEDITEDTLILTMEKSQRQRILDQYENANFEHIFVLTEFVGEELEILDPYGGTLQNYGLCYETLQATIKKLVRILNEGV